MKKILKQIYKSIPFKRELFYGLKMIWRPNENIYKHLYFVGVIKVDVNKSKSFKVKHHGFQIENEIFWAGLTNGWEKESMKLWIKLCENSKIILDIGANTGIYSLVAKTINPLSKVYAFEPVKRVFTKLQQNISLNSFDILAFEKAVSNSNGTAVIYDTDTEHTLSVTVNKNLSEPDAYVIETTIQTITLNSFIEEHNLPKIDLIKIDVETHEPEVIEGFSKYLAIYKPALLIEILNNEIGQKIEEMVKGLDYLYFNIDENKGIRQVDKITKSDYYNYLLCNLTTALKIGLVK